MKQYKGYYIDGVHFTSESEIDNHIKQKAIKRYEQLSKWFAENPSMELSIASSEQADYLHDVIGMSWNDIEAIEISAIA
jgi:hypothetical protein